MPIPIIVGASLYIEIVQEHKSTGFLSSKRLMRTVESVFAKHISRREGCIVQAKAHNSGGVVSHSLTKKGKAEMWATESRCRSK